MKILLLVSAFNGLTQRVWCALNEAGHDITVELASAYKNTDDLVPIVHSVSPDVILCPFLKHRVPSAVWQKWPTVIIHPGPVGDRGPSSLDYAITENEPRWGVTALAAVEDMDAGPVYATRVFDLPAELSKAAIYNGPVADAALECVMETITKLQDPTFSPTPQERCAMPVASATTRPSMKQAQRAFQWSQPAAVIVRSINAADSSPGVRTVINGQTVSVYDAAVGDPCRYPPGTIVARHGDAIAVASGDKLVWITQAKQTVANGGKGIKLPASMVLDVHQVPETAPPVAVSEAHYERRGDIGMFTIRAYNGAMSTAMCRRVLPRLTDALAQDTRVVVIRGTSSSFSNGIHLNVIEAASDPAREAWRNIVAINALCSAVASAEQLTVGTFTANAGAGGVMFGLSTDIVLARAGVVLNPYYDMGLYGSELHTYTLPRRVGSPTASRLLTEKLPIDARGAQRIGMVDSIGPRAYSDFESWLWEMATSYTNPQWYDHTIDAKRRHRERALPLEYFEAQELSQMARDFFEDRNGFASARKAFVGKHDPHCTPAKLAGTRWNLVGAGR